MSLVICFTDQTWELNVLEFKLWHFSFPWRIMCTFVVEGRSIPSIDLQATFNLLLNTWSTTRSILSRHSISMSIDTWLTLDRVLVDIHLSVDWLVCINQLTTKFWLRVLINTRPWMPLVHMIPWYVYVYFPGMTHTTDNCCHLLCLLVWV